MDAPLAAGTEFEGELAFYPGRLPLRALVKSRAEGVQIGADLGAAADATIEAGLRKYAEALAANPWLIRWPLALGAVRLVQERESWFLVDSRGSGLPLKDSFAAGLQLWRLLSASGGGDVTVLAEWDGRGALPLSMLGSHGFLDLAPRWAA